MRKNSLLAAGRLRRACGQLRKRVTGCSPKDGERARSGMPCSTGRGRRLHTLSLQSLEVGHMPGRNRQLAYSTNPTTSASSAACRQVPEHCCAPRRARMPASGCEPSPRTRARSFCRWTCKSLSGDAFACRYPWHLPVATWRARVPSRGGPAGRPSRRLRPEWAAGPARSHTRASVGPSSAGGRRRRRAGGPPTVASTDHRSGRSPR